MATSPNMELKFFVESTQKIKTKQREKNREAERRKTAKVSPQGEQIESINRISEKFSRLYCPTSVSPCLSESP
jgi:hypothetical protein